MLARIAQELFWLGRDLARAEHTARMLDGVFHADVAGGPGEGGIALSWEAVLAIIGAKPPEPRNATEEAAAVGSDADLILIDPEHEVQIKSSEMQSRSDFDPYEGYVAKGWPVLTMSRGDVIVHREQVKSTPGRGRLLRRRRYQAL